jgi:hypothetical protein
MNQRVSRRFGFKGGILVVALDKLVGGAPYLDFLNHGEACLLVPARPGPSSSERLGLRP